eukprot:1563405-Rhodomonas_salina.1
MESDSRTKSLDSIAEGMGDASLVTSDWRAQSKAALNPNEEADKDVEERSRSAERESIQSRLPFVPRRPFSLDGVSDSELTNWLSNLQSVISDTSRVVYDNLSLMAGGEAATEDGSGPMDGLDLSQ